jgi:hypothetical protein
MSPSDALLVLASGSATDDISRLLSLDEFGAPNVGAPIEQVTYLDILRDAGLLDEATFNLSDSDVVQSFVTSISGYGTKAVSSFVDLMISDAEGSLQSLDIGTEFGAAAFNDRDVLRSRSALRSLAKHGQDEVTSDLSMWSCDIADIIHNELESKLQQAHGFLEQLSFESERINVANDLLSRSVDRAAKKARRLSLVRRKVRAH